MNFWPNKDPDEVLDYQVDWSARLEGVETVLISTFTTTGSVVIDSAGFTSQGIATVWLSGGVAGDMCEVRNHIVTTFGREYDETVRLRIRDK